MAESMTMAEFLEQRERALDAEIQRLAQEYQAAVSAREEVRRIRAVTSPQPETKTKTRGRRGR